MRIVGERGRHYLFNVRVASPAPKRLGTRRKEEGNDMTDHRCFSCGGQGDLSPLYPDRSPDAQPIAWAHLDCIRQSAEDVSHAQGMVEAMARWRTIAAAETKQRVARNGEQA
jgi:hypothetical protein